MSDTTRIEGPYKVGDECGGDTGTRIASRRDQIIANAAYQQGRQQALAEVNAAADSLPSIDAERRCNPMWQRVKAAKRMWGGWVVTCGPGGEEKRGQSGDTFTEALFNAATQNGENDE